MKKRYIWLIAITTSSALLALLYMQALYFQEVIEICADQFDLQAQRSMRKVARDTDESLKILPAYDDLTLKERVNGENIDSRLRRALRENGIDVGYHFRVTAVDGREIYRCSDYQPVGGAKEYTQELFIHSPKAQMGVLRIYFPERRKYILETVHYMVPVVILILIVLVMFIITIWVAFHQKRLSEIKNDFINNMTHELKTPISSISLAAQMLADTSMPKTEQSLQRLSGVIVDETRRLRFLVDRVLQMSMFDRHEAATFKMKELSANTLISDVVSTFRLKVENTGGSLTADLADGATDIMADEMHLTNVIFNLMDNAVKYRDENRPLQLQVSTRIDGEHLYITVKDNGIGLHHDDLKKIFDRFYRVGTGNRHDVKGFGLGLAYVKSVITGFGGHIHAESEYGEGTRFIIKLKLANKNNQ